MNLPLDTTHCARAYRSRCCVTMPHPLQTRETFSPAISKAWQRINQTYECFRPGQGVQSNENVTGGIMPSQRMSID